MNNINKTNEELMLELQELKKEYESLKISYAKAVSDKIIAEKVVEETHKQVEMMFQDNQAIVLIIEPDHGFIVDSNLKAKDFYGYSKVQLCNFKLQDLCINSSDEVLNELQSARLNQKNNHIFQQKISTGEVKTVEIFFTPSKVFNKNVLFSIVQDITESKRIEDDLRDSEEKFRLIFENTSEAILFTEPEGKIYFINQECIRLFGYTNEEFKIIGRNGIVDLADERLPAALEERRRTGKFKGELNFIRKDGSIFPCEVTTNIFHNSQGQEMSSIVLKDISKKKIADAATHQIFILECSSSIQE